MYSLLVTTCVGMGRKGDEKGDEAGKEEAGDE